MPCPEGKNNTGHAAGDLLPSEAGALEGSWFFCSPCHAMPLNKSVKYAK